MFSKFFIERPIFANVIAIVTMLIGAVSLWGLPVEQYPEITPPTVRVTANYRRTVSRWRSHCFRKK
jgi:HAE1 family hydrophobic/amphiphilic exporter-1